jgi:DNA-binding MarR family transcriptional regulator
MPFEELTHLMIIAPGIISRRAEHMLINQVCAELDLSLASHHIMVLALLQETGPMFIHEVCETLSISKSQMTFLTDRLVSMGLIDRSPEEEDRRKVRLNLSLRGRWVIEEIQKSIQRLLNQKLAGITSDQRVAFEGALEVMLDFSKMLK